LTNVFSDTNTTRTSNSSTITVSNTGVITVTEAGNYLLTGTVSWANNTSFQREAYFLLSNAYDGITAVGSSKVVASGYTGDIINNCSICLPLVASTTVQLMGLQNSGSSLNTGASCVFSVMKICS
jgi:hypothetical protein